VVYYLHGDHLGSTSLTTDQSGNKFSEVRYLPYGQEREIDDTPSPTDFGFTGQRKDGFGLMDYNARYYSPYLGRFVSPDTMVPDPTSSSGFNRYRYARNNPLKYVDPSGHYECEDAFKCDPPIAVREPDIVSREEWGALEPGANVVCLGEACPGTGWSEGMFDPSNPEATADGYRSYSDLGYDSLAEVLDEIVIHHSGNVPTYDMQTLQRQHMFGTGMADVGYHFAIDPDGIIYEGRDIGVRGNHALRGNTGRIGVLLMGDFQPGDELKMPGTTFHLPARLDNYGAPTNAQMQSAVDLVQYLDAEYGIESVVGHQDVPENDTECPGALCLPFVKELDNIVKAN
jgi:RHS repeat-associated protein